MRMLITVSHGEEKGGKYPSTWRENRCQASEQQVTWKVRDIDAFDRW
jgi:hypothetical protein